MASKAKKNQTDKLAAKRAAVLGAGPKKRLPILVVIGAVTLIAAGALLYNRMDTRNLGAVAPAPTSADSTVVSFPVSLFEDGKARHFEQPDGKLTIRYFVLKSADGVIRAAFDACDVCWPAGKGYVQEGDHMVCRNCGRRFASVLVNEVKGGCNPAPLNRGVADGKVIILVKDILAGKQYFDFPEKS
jgi:uncharacterized membrane protein